MYAKEIELLSNDIELHKRHFEFEKIAEERLMVKPRFSLISYTASLIDKRVESIGSFMTKLEKAEYKTILNQRREFIKERIEDESFRMIDLYNLKDIEKYVQTGEGLLEKNGKPIWIDNKERADQLIEIINMLKKNYEILFAQESIGFDFLITASHLEQQTQEFKFLRKPRFMEGALMLVSTEIRAKGMNRGVVITVPSLVKRFREIFNEWCVESRHVWKKVFTSLNFHNIKPDFINNIKNEICKQKKGNQKNKVDYETFLQTMESDYKKINNPLSIPDEVLIKTGIRLWFGCWALENMREQNHSPRLIKPELINKINLQLESVIEKNKDEKNSIKGKLQSNINTQTSDCPFQQTGCELCPSSNTEPHKAIISFDYQGKKSDLKNSSWETVISLENAINELLKQIGFKPIITRNLRQNSHNNWQDLCSALANCDLLIADLSYWGDKPTPRTNITSPFVAFELGMALAKRRHLILTFHKGESEREGIYRYLSNLSGINPIIIPEGIEKGAYNLGFLEAIQKHIESVLPDILNLELGHVVEVDTKMQNEFLKFDSLNFDRYLVKSRFSAATYTQEICGLRAERYFNSDKGNPDKDTYNQILWQRATYFKDSLNRREHCVDIYSMKDTMEFAASTSEQTRDFFLSEELDRRKDHFDNMLDLLDNKHYKVYLTDEGLGFDYIILGPIVILTSSSFEASIRGIIISDPKTVTSFVHQFQELEEKTRQSLILEFSELYKKLIITNDAEANFSQNNSKNIDYLIHQFKINWKPKIKIDLDESIKAGIKLYLSICKLYYNNEKLLQAWHNPETRIIAIADLLSSAT